MISRFDFKYHEWTIFIQNEFVTQKVVIYRGYSNFLLNMAFISPSEVENIYIS